MSDMPTDPPAPNADASAAPQGDVSEAVAKARARLDGQLDFLQAVADSELRLALGYEARGVADAADREKPAEDLRQIGLAHQGAMRGARMAILLQSRLVSELHRMERDIARDAERARSRAALVEPGLEWRRKKQIERIVWRVATDTIEDNETCDRLAREAGEQLEMDELYGEVLSRPISELVAELCADIGLSPDWPALAEEAWARAEIAGGEPGEPLAALTKELSRWGMEPGRGPPAGLATTPDVQARPDKSTDFDARSPPD
jgi:hypothetical protein